MALSISSLVYLVCFVCLNGLFCDAPVTRRLGVKITTYYNTYALLKLFVKLFFIYNEIFLNCIFSI